MYLFLNDVSGSEIFVILIFILIFFGSKSIPGIARTLGRTMRQVKDATSEIQNELKKSTDGYKKDLNLEGIFRDTAEEIKQPLDQMAVDLDHSIRYNPNSKLAVNQPAQVAENEAASTVSEENSTDKVETTPPTESTENQEKTV
ncbi:MAG: twin-arginine translocase TatA/TatE family subunit [Crocinitomicaceae bacterium]